MPHVRGRSSAYLTVNADIKLNNDPELIIKPISVVEPKITASERSSKSAGMFFIRK